MSRYDVGMDQEGNEQWTGVPLKGYFVKRKGWTTGMWVAVRAQYQVERAQVQCAVQQVRMQNAGLGERSTLVGEEGVADWKLGWAV